MLTVEMRNFVDQLREYTNQAQTHLTAAGAAHDEGDDKALAASHRALGGVLRGMHRTFDSIGKAGAAADQANTQTVQTSSGTGKSDGSAGGRGSPLYLHGNAGIAGWLQRAREGGRK
jgi:hypothetical protein